MNNTVEAKVEAKAEAKVEAKVSEASTAETKPLNLGKSKKGDDEISLGSCAYRIIDQQSKQIAKLRSPVLKDADPEPLHQMRVGTRKLRSALTLFSDVVKVDSKGKKSGLSKLTKSLKKLTQALGNVRDLDVMQQWFEQALIDYGTSSSKKKVKKDAAKKEEKVGKGDRAFSKAEIETIQTLLKQLKKRRKGEFSNLKESLKGKDYKKLTGLCKQWVKQPAFTAAAQQPAYYGAAQRIVGPISELMAHPGWLAATRQQPNQKNVQKTVPIARITLAKLNRQLAQESEGGEQLHDLRKQIKRVRYQTEFFRGIYGTAYAAQIREFRDMQSILGGLQDQIVISQFLTDALGSDWAQQLPTIEANFQAARLDLWKQWQPYQQKYLKLRSGLSASPQAA